MDVVDSLVFTQTIIWGFLLIKKSEINNKVLGGTFLIVSVTFLLNYLLRISSLSSPPILFPTITIMVGLLLSASLTGIFTKNPRRQERFSWNVRLVVSVLFIIFSLIIKIDHTYLWYFVMIVLFLGFLSDSGSLIYRIKNRNHTGSPLNDQTIRTQLVILSGILILLLVGLIGMISFSRFILDGTMDKLFYYILPGVVFIVGFTSISGPEIKVIKNSGKLNPGTQSENVLLINELMKEEKPYLDCELTLGKMASMLNMDDHDLTRILKEEMGLNFYGLINDLRVKAAAEMLLIPENKNFSIMAVAYDCGFNSKSTFYRIFKEYIGVIPKEYMGRSQK